ncbi:hypothetical protein, partial [Mycolicibacterium tokaiense]|uniref:hypothetical protein n=1 Tax=Mycolicibacterium tokaiense TaxID=39695 RepID=UPI0021F36AB2
MSLEARPWLVSLANEISAAADFQAASVSSTGVVVVGVGAAGLLGDEQQPVGGDGGGQGGVGG